MHRTSVVVSHCVGWSAMLLAGASWAADIPADLRIDEVTVYAQGAMVTRKGAANFPAGSHRLVIKGLPAGIDSKLLRVTVGSTAVRLGSVEVTTVNESRFVTEKERELRAQIEAKGDQRAAIQDEMDTAQTQLKLLESLAANPTGGANGSSAVNGANLGAVLTSISANATTARNKVRDAKLKERTIDREIETLKAELAKVSTNRKQTTEVAVNVDVSAAANAPISLAYRVGDASWQWVYQARLDTTTKKLSLERQGQVQQGSGEDWKSVQLTLTTAQPEGDISTPVAYAQFLDLYVPQPVAPAPMVRGVMKSAAQDNIQLPETIVTAQKVAFVSTDYLVEYQVPSRVTLNADLQWRLFPISDENFDTQLVARVVPSQNRRAYLEATFKYERDTPIEAGQLQLYRDGAFVGEALTQAFLPGAEVRMPFGADERIKVVVRDEAAKSDQSSVFGKQISKETKQRFEITSYHASAIPVEVLDRVPVSKNDDIKVEVLKGATEPTTKDVEGKSGVYLWKLNAEPQKTAVIRHYYAVKYPKDRLLQSSEE
jgi:uncharacterized protein (TIGR02231 family)